jgi:hypothetical protein
MSFACSAVHALSLVRNATGDTVYLATGRSAGSLALTIRNSVAARTVASRELTLIYLSVFEDQIDSRLEQFLQRSSAAGKAMPSHAGIGYVLEPTDAMILLGAGEGQVSVVRGGACRLPLYWRTSRGRLELSTRLPVDERRCLSKRGLLDALTVVSVTLQNEPNFSTATPLADWRRCRRAASSILDDRGLVREEPIDFSEAPAAPHDKESVIASIREAFARFGARLRNHAHVFFELSGGFDSTLAALSARAQGIRVRGASVRFPYYEFRHEEEIQQSVAATFSCTRDCIDGTDFLPYAPSDWIPALDEPATIVMSLKRDLEIVRLAGRNDATRILVGHGGDQIFSEDLLQPVPDPSALDRRAFLGGTWETTERFRQSVLATPGYLRRSMLTYLHDARLDIAFMEKFGTMSISPFSDLAMISSALAWARLSASLGIVQGKRILADAYDAELPAALLNRRSKVAWDGVCGRAYAQHASSIMDPIECLSGPLEALGLNVGWLARRTRELADWKTTAYGMDDRELFAAYAIAMWLRSWGVERLSDCDWAA